MRKKAIVTTQRKGHIGPLQKPCLVYRELLLRRRRRRFGLHTRPTRRRIWADANRRNVPTFQSLL